MKMKIGAGKSEVCALSTTGREGEARGRTAREPKEKQKLKASQAINKVRIKTASA